MRGKEPSLSDFLLVLVSKQWLSGWAYITGPSRELPFLGLMVNWRPILVIPIASSFHILKRIAKRLLNLSPRQPKSFFLNIFGCDTDRISKIVDELNKLVIQAFLSLTLFPHGDMSLHCDLHACRPDFPHAHLWSWLTLFKRKRYDIMFDSLTRLE